MTTLANSPTHIRNPLTASSTLAAIGLALLMVGCGPPNPGPGDAGAATDTDTGLELELETDEDSETETGPDPGCEGGDASGTDGTIPCVDGELGCGCIVEGLDWHCLDPAAICEVGQCVECDLGDLGCGCDVGDSCLDGLTCVDGRCDN